MIAGSPVAAVAPLVVRVPEDPAAVMVFSGRDPQQPGAGNVSLVIGPGDPGRVRAELLGAAGLGLGNAVFMEQVHGAGVATVGHAHAGRGARVHAEAVPGVDALVTRATGLALAVLVADCVPVLLVDPRRAVAAVHAGRGGVASGVVPAALAALDPPDPGAVVAVLGPAIGGCCYEVPPDLAEAVAAEVPVARATTTWGTAALDLPAAVTAQLAAAGVERVRRVGGCTRCESDRWFSHRGAPGTGRQAAIVARVRLPGPAQAPPYTG